MNKAISHLFIRAAVLTTALLFNVFCGGSGPSSPTRAAETLPVTPSAMPAILPQTAGQIPTVSANLATSAFPNGGFETLPAGGTNDWTWPGSPWAWDGNIAHSGSHSARVSRSSGGETSSVNSPYIAVQPSREYTLIYWLRTQTASWYPRVVLSQYNSGGDTTGPNLVAYANIGNGDNDWMEVSYRFQTMPDAAQIRLRLYLYTDTTGTFWFDDFNLVEGALARFRFRAGFPVSASGQVWLSSPVVADINNDGNNEILIGAGNDVDAWDKMGVPLPGYPVSTGDRSIVAQIALADLDHDNRMEIVAGTRAVDTEGRCRVFAWQDDGTLLSGWPISVAWNPEYSNNNCWISSVVLADIDGDGELEILASTTNNGSANASLDLETPNLYAWHVNGSLVSGNWPNWQTTAGIYGALAAGDINKDGKADVVVGRDYLYLNVYGANGQSLPGWPVKTYVNQNGGNYDTEQRIEYSVNAPTIADLDGDGVMEIIVTGHVKGPGSYPDVKLNSALLVLEPDGTRRPGWEKAALGNGILSQVDMPWQEPVIADINGDGQREIIVPTEDGSIRAYSANKDYLWSFDFTFGKKLFATEPVIGDIDGDGTLEIVFGTYVPMLVDSDKDGPVGLWALDPDGTVEPGFPLAIPTPGMRSAPTLADLDGDGNLDILAATRDGKVYAWATAAAYNPARLPWPVGRHDLRRSAVYTSLSPLEMSYKNVSPTFVKQGETAAFSIRISSAAPINETVSLTDTIPAGLSLVPGTLHATSGVASAAGGEIQWSGSLPASLSVDITYNLMVNTSAQQVIRNTAVISTLDYGTITRTAVVYANFIRMFLPLMTQ